MRARTVLLVSSQPKLRSAARALAGPAVRVLDCASGLAALVICAGHAVDLVLLDQTAPGMDAARLAQKLSEAFPDLAVQPAAPELRPQISAYLETATRKAPARAYAWLTESRQRRGA